MHDSISHLTEELLSTLIDDRLAPDERAAADAHLSVCERCTDALAGLNTVVTTLRLLPEPPLPRSFQIQPEHRPSIWSRLLSWDIGIRGLATAAAALFMVLMVGDLSSASQPKSIVPITVSNQAKSAPEARSAASVPTAGPAPTAAPAPAGIAGAPPPAPPRRTEPATDAALAPSETAKVEAFTARESAAGAANAFSGLHTTTLVMGALAVLLIITAVVRSVRRA